MHRSWYIQLNPHTRNPKWKSEVQDEKLKQFQGDSVEYMKLRSLYFGRTAKIQTLGLRVIAFISGTVQPVKNTSWIFFFTFSSCISLFHSRFLLRGFKWICQPPPRLSSWPTHTADTADTVPWVLPNIQDSLFLLLENATRKAYKKYKICLGF